MMSEYTNLRNCLFLNDLNSEENAFVFTGTDAMYSRSLMQNEGTSIAIAAIAARIAIASRTAFASFIEVNIPARFGSRYATEKPAI